MGSTINQVIETMTMERALLIIVLILVISVVMYIYGSRSWGSMPLPRRKLLPFFFYLQVVNMKFFLKHQRKVDFMLHLMKAHDEIAGRVPNIPGAQKKMRETTDIDVLDVYDDLVGHRYIKLRSPDQGEFVIEIREYYKASLTKKYKDQRLAKKPSWVKPDQESNLREKTGIRVIK